VKVRVRVHVSCHVGMVVWVRIYASLGMGRFFVTLHHCLIPLV